MYKNQLENTIKDTKYASNKTSLNQLENTIKDTKYD